MRLKILQPADKLKEFVQYYWILEDEHTLLEQTQYVYPEGNMQLIFHYGDTLDVVNPDGIITKQDNSMLCCQKYHGYKVIPTGKIGMFSVNFNPYGASVFFNLPLKELLNQNIDLCSIMGDKISTINEMLYEATNDEKKKLTIDKFLLDLLYINNYNEIEIIKRSLNLINSKICKININELGKASFVSTRHLERIFIKRIGLSPKQFLRIKQINYAVSLLRSSSYDNLTQVAIESGFYDQSHFIKSFKSIIGIKPFVFEQLTKNDF